jgi:hypothetical protein
MVEDTGSYRRLFRYLWIEGSWRCEGPFEVVDRARWNDVGQEKTDISDIFEGRFAVDTIRIVIEDGVVVRWWHTYLFRSNRWELCCSHHAVVESEDGNLFVYDDESSSEPDIVD